LIDRKHIEADDFKKYHPGGALGQRLKSRVADFMLSGEKLPIVPETLSIGEAVEEINRKGLGATLVVNNAQKLIGIITDGDVRRAIVKYDTVRDVPVKALMTVNPRTVQSDSPTYDALNIMEQHQITVLPVTGSDGHLQGIIHLHDILGKGEFKFNGS
jgi:arabinose-5-phosphate isomerase